MPKSYVYRIEDESGIGPYQLHKGCIPETKHVSIRKLLERHNNAYSHPKPYLDVNRWLLEAFEKCGFKSKAQLYGWFTKAEIEWLEQNGYTLKKIPRSEVVIIGRGKKQITFARKSEIPLDNRWHPDNVQE